MPILTTDTYQQLNLFGDFTDAFSDSDEPEINIDQINKEITDEYLLRHGSGTLEEISPEILPGTGGEGDVTKDTDTGIRSDGRSDGDISVRSEPSPERSRGDSSAPIHPADSGDGLEIRGVGGLRNGHTDDRGNYRVTLQDNIGVGGPVAKFDKNLAALKLIKHLDDQQRHATPEEQSILVQYTGWGGLSQVFKHDLDGKWLERQNALKEILTDKEYNSASRSTMNAHYTEPEIARQIWNAVVRMGYSGGPTLEPAAGTGLFFGVKPENIPVSMHGIELDMVSGKIAQHLNQSADIIISPYESFQIPKDYYNLVISNIPFSGLKPYEEEKLRTPGIESGKYSLHDFYFLKSLYGTKPGGIVAFITSRYTLDKLDTEVREKIAQSADFIGAIRLPNTAFKGIADTEVVTDIIFLQKREAGKEPTELTNQIINTGILKIDDQEISVNQYFIDNPDMILGTNALTGRMYQRNEYTVNPGESDINKSFEDAITKLPENIYNVVDIQESTLATSLTNSIENPAVNKLAHGSFYIHSDGKLYRKNSKTGELDLSPLYETENINRESINRVMGMVRIAESVRKAIDHHYNNQQVSTKDEIKNLNILYDNYVKQYGFINDKRNFKLIKDSPDSTLLCALEKWDGKNKKAKKTDIFSGINFAKKVHVTHVDSPVDAMVLSLARFGSLNIRYMESITGTDSETLVKQLLDTGKIYIDPAEYLNNGRTSYLTADNYLSGNIREKIRIAEKATEKNPSLFTKNIIDLNAKAPTLLTPEDIMVRLNSPVISEKHVKEFVGNLVNALPHDVHILHLAVNGKWDITVPIWAADKTLRDRTYGTAYIDAIRILNCIMNGKPIKVYDKDNNGIQILNLEKTALAEQKAEDINKAFQAWIWKDIQRTDDIVKRYNEVFNGHIDRKYIHPERLLNEKADIYMHGCNFAHPLRPHQADAIWRILQSKNVMLAHSVGAGKTLEMVCSAMELRRLGLRSKPMIVCPDHMIGQWAKEFRTAYPNAKLHVADDENWKKENRQTFINSIATGDWDAIIIRAESFKMIPLSNDIQESFFTNKIKEHKEALASVAREDRGSRSVKQLEKSIQSYEDKLKALADMNKDDVIPFDKLGVDQLFIDEADLYKNLEYYTQLQNVRGLGNAAGSERALDMYMKVRHVQSKDGGVVFATGTPISNTLVEAYTMQRLLQPEVLKANGLEAFDEWARQFAETVTQMELSNTGTGYVPVTRFSKIVNVPELVTTLKQVWDIQTAQSLESSGILVPGVNLPVKTIINEAAPSTPLMRSYLKYLEKRENDLKGKGPARAGEDNILSIMTDGRKASIDMRLIHPNLPDDPNSKLNIAMSRIHQIYEQYKTEGYTTAIFCDKSRSFDKYGTIKFDAIEDMKKKLIALGVDKNQIGDVRECKNFAERQELFNQVSEGTKRIIFGSTESMGAGTNFQQKLKAIFHIDAPWRPRDIEQQNGRGYRPGNTTGELLVYNMVTKGSLDTGLWNVLETKANSIREIMDGSDKTTRSIDEDYYGSVRDLSIDNQLMKESMELDHDLKKLKILQRGYNIEIANASRLLQDLPVEKEKAQKEFDAINKDISLRAPEMKGKEFKIIIDGAEYKERKEAGLAIIQIANDAQSTDPREIIIGSYAGYPLILKTVFFADNDVGDSYEKKHWLSVKGNFNKYGVDIKENPDPVGLIVSLNHAVYNNPDNLLKNSLDKIESFQAKENSYREILDKPFERDEEITTKEARYKEVMILLQKENAERIKREGNNQLKIDWTNINSLNKEKLNTLINNYLSGEFVEKIDESERNTIETKNEKVKEEIVEEFDESERKAINPIDTKEKEIEKFESNTTIIIDDRVQDTLNRYGVTIQPVNLTELNKQIEEKKLTPDQVMNIISKTVRNQDKNGRSWHDDITNSDFQTYKAVYATDKNNYKSGDIFIKQNIDETPQYSVLVLKDDKMRVLGLSNNLDELMLRTKNYDFNVALKAEIVKEVLKLENGKNQNEKTIIPGKNKCEKEYEM